MQPTTHKTLKLQKLYYENLFKIPITSFIQRKTQVVHWQSISPKRNPQKLQKIVVILAIFKCIHGDIAGKSDSVKEG